MKRRLLSYLLPSAMLLGAASINTLTAADPLWWETRGIIDPLAPGNNQGAASIGQAKHFVKKALLELEQRIPAAKHLQIVSDLAPIVDLQIPADAATNTVWKEKQKAPLTVGQLKALAKPFYFRLRELNGSWLDTRMSEHRIRVSLPTNPITFSPYPWTPDPADDQNTALATVGQLKAVFSLPFEELPPLGTDTDGDGIPDSWEEDHDLDPEVPSDGNGDADGDGLSNHQEYLLGTNPNEADSDGDGLLDGFEIDNNLVPTNGDQDGNGINDGLDDFDGDGATNSSEQDSGSDPGHYSEQDQEIQSFASQRYLVVPLDIPAAGPGLTRYYVEKIYNDGTIDFFKTYDPTPGNYGDEIHKIYNWNGGAVNDIALHKYRNKSGHSTYTEPVPQAPPVDSRGPAVIGHVTGDQGNHILTVPEFRQEIFDQAEEFYSFYEGSISLSDSPERPIVTRSAHGSITEDGRLFAEISQYTNHWHTRDAYWTNEGWVYGTVYTSDVRTSEVSQFYQFDPFGANPLHVLGGVRLARGWTSNLSMYSSVQGAGGMGSSAFAIIKDTQVDDYEVNAFNHQVYLRNGLGVNLDLTSMGFDGFSQIAAGRNGHVVTQTNSGGLFYDFKTRELEALPGEFERGAWENSGVDVNDNGDVVAYHDTDGWSNIRNVLGRRIEDAETGRLAWAVSDLNEAVSGEWTNLMTTSIANTMPVQEQLALEAQSPPAYPPAKPALPIIGGTAEKNGLMHPVVLVPYEINSLDRYLEVGIPMSAVRALGGVEAMKIQLAGGGNLHGNVATPLSEALIYESEEGMLSDAEIANYGTQNDNPKAHEDEAQDVVFWREGEMLKFATTFDTAGPVVINFLANDVVVSSADYTLTEMTEFSALIDQLDYIIDGVRTGRYLDPSGGGALGLTALRSLDGSGGNQQSLMGFGMWCRNLVTKCVKPAFNAARDHVFEGVAKVSPGAAEALKIVAIGAQGFVQGLWAGVMDDWNGMVEGFEFFTSLVSNPVEACASFARGFEQILHLTWEQIKSIPATMVKEFLAGAAEDIAWTGPVDNYDLTVYVINYTTGFFCEKVGLAALTGGATVALQGTNIAAKFTSVISKIRALQPVLDAIKMAENATKAVNAMKARTFRALSQYVPNRDGMTALRQYIELKMPHCSTP
jgi:hypothetical protein